MIRYETYSIDEVFKAMENNQNLFYKGRKLNLKSPRLILFKNKGVKCVDCDLEGTIFIVETHHKDVPPHLNLYAENARKQGELTLITKDHIIPASKGGPNHQDNYQTMCTDCNMKKGAKIR